MPPSLKWLSRLADTVGTLAIPLLKFDWATIRRLLAVNSLFDATRIVGNFSNMKDLIFHVDMKVAASSPVPLPAKPTSLPAHFTFRSETFNTAHWMAERRFTAIVALRDGHITHEDYFLGHGARGSADLVVDGQERTVSGIRRGRNQRDDPFDRPWRHRFRAITEGHRV